MKYGTTTYSFLGLLVFSSLAPAADGISPGTERPGERQPLLPQYLQEVPQGGVVLPVVPPVERPFIPEGGAAFELQGVVFEGNTVFSEQDLTSVAKPFLAHRVTLADLEELRYRLTRYYTDRGYINSGVILKPGQNVKEGVVAFRVLEGRLDQVRVKGVGRLRPDYVRERIWPESEMPFNIHALQDNFQLLLRDPLIKRMDGKLQPGSLPGSAILDLDVTRACPWDLSLNIDNHRPPSTGSERGYLSGVVRNLTGFGDYLNLATGMSEGATEGSVLYSVPLTARDTRVWLRFDGTDSSVIEEPLEALDIESETRSLELGIDYPIQRTLRRTFTLGAALAVRENKTFLLDEPFSFSSGADEGKSRVAVIRLIQELIKRTSNRALALRSTVSIGIDAFNSTVYSDARPDSEYVSWLGQAQYARILGNRGIQLILRGDAQFASDKLLDLERFVVGGVRTVRGYRENELVRDNGVVVSAELRYPLQWQGVEVSSATSLQLAAFMDYGTAWNKNSEHDELQSVGLGLLWNHRERYNAEIFVAHAIKEARPRQDYDLQDDGIHFRLSLNL